MTWYVCVDATGHPAVRRDPIFDVVQVCDTEAQAEALVDDIKAARSANQQTSEPA